MTKLKALLFCLLCLCVGGIIFTEAFAQTPEGREVPREKETGQWFSESGAAVVVGDYGTSDDTTITQLSQTLTVQDPQGGTISLSIGYGQMKSGDTCQTLIRRADDQLYSARQLLRSALAISQDEPVRKTA